MSMSSCTLSSKKRWMISPPQEVLSICATKALIEAYGFNIVENYSRTLNLTDRWVGNRQAGFGTPISPQYQLASCNITDLNLSVYAPHGLEYGLFVRNVFDNACEVSGCCLAN